MEQKKKYIRFDCRIAFLIFLFSLLFHPIHAQYKFRYDNDDFTTLTIGRGKQNGFSISLSLVALFTAGSIDRNGFRLGAGLTLSQTIDQWTFSTGLDAYKAQQRFGIGTSFAGAEYRIKAYGASYYVNKYYQGDKQVSGIVRLYLNDFQINFEDDILAYPFVGFKIYDRYRTAALELRYKGFILGTNVYTTDINGMTDIALDNKMGKYLIGKQVSSPLYLGYSTNNIIVRYGINNKIGGLIGQNGWHQLFFNTPNFNQGDYNNQFFQIGVDKPYTLY